jgi:hypothetical protein
MNFFKRNETVDDILIGARQYIDRLNAVAESNSKKSESIKEEVTRLNSEDRAARDEASRAIKLRDKFSDLITV